MAGYGAYELRKENSITTSKAVVIGGLLFALAISTPLIVKFISGFVPEEEAIKVTDVVLQPPPAVDDKKVPPPPPEPPKPKIDQVKFPPLAVVPEEQVKDEEPPTVEELKVADPGQQKVEGDPNADIVINEPVGNAPKEAEVTEDNSIKDFASIEIQPQFPGGGLAAFGKYVGKNFRYSPMAREQGVSGKVIMSFVVEKDGNLTDIKVLRDLGLGTGEEAIRVLKASPRWSPGIQNGRPVRVAYTLPIALKLESE